MTDKEQGQSLSLKEEMKKLGFENEDKERLANIRTFTAEDFESLLLYRDSDSAKCDSHGYNVLYQKYLNYLRRALEQFELNSMKTAV